MIAALRRLISDDAADWLTTVPASEFDEPVVGELVGCDVVRVLERDSNRPRCVMVRIVARLTATHGGRHHHREVESYWTMTHLDGMWRRTAREAAWMQCTTSTTTR